MWEMALAIPHSFSVMRKAGSGVELLRTGRRAETASSMKEELCRTSLGQSFMKRKLLFHRFDYPKLS